MNELNIWCEHNKLEVNVSKSKVIHVRTPSTLRSIIEFKKNDRNSKSICVHRSTINRTHELYENGKAGPKLASRALGLLRTKFKTAEGGTLLNVDYIIQQYSIKYNKLRGINLGIRRFTCIKAVQNCALRFFIGAGRYMPNAAVNGVITHCELYYSR